MSPTALLAALRTRVIEAARTWMPGARGAWCRSQRRRLRTSGGSVVWLRGAAVGWAEWGARRGYFEVQYMDGLAYLRAASAPTA
jgi:hypothetical protein